jgi:hypothetical protein
MTNNRNRSDLLLVCLLGLTSCDPIFTCEEKNVATAASPDQEYKVVYSVSSCGATTPDVTSVYLLHRGMTSHSGIAAVAAFRGDLDNSPKWDGNTLVVDYGTAKPVKMTGKFERIQIVYLSPQETGQR